MGLSQKLTLLAAGVALSVPAVTVTVTVAAAAPAAAQSNLYKNCTHLNHRWPHGVGRNHAHDHTSGVPVTNFKHSTRLYKRAMNHNKGLDRDKDGIACEKH
jgi:hypothetical protein